MDTNDAIRTRYETFFGQDFMPLILATEAALSIFGHNSAVITIFAKDVLRVGPEGLGLLLSAVGAGAIVGTIVLVGVGDLRPKRSREQIGGLHLAPEQVHHALRGRPQLRARLLRGRRGRLRRLGERWRGGDNEQCEQQALQHGNLPDSCVLDETGAPLHRYAGKAFRESEMPVSSMDVVERIARVIAGRVLSANAEGEDCSASDEVDAVWRDYRGDAVAILRTLREPDPAMAEAGDLTTWQRMIGAALSEAGAS